MLLKRVIPNILLSENALYKTKNFKNKKYIGDPINTVKLFNDLEVDELIILDIDSSKRKVKPNLKLIEEIVSEAFMPICYGGGIDDIEIAKKIFASGVEKISINSKAIQDLGFIEKLAKIFGNQSIVLSVDIKKNLFGKFKIYSHKDNKNINLDYKSFIKRCIDNGVGEILLTSVDKEGTLSGFDLELINIISNSFSVPLIANGGGSDLSDIKAAFQNGASAVSCGSKFVYEGPYKAVLINYLNENEIYEINNEKIITDND